MARFEAQPGGGRGSSARRSWRPPVGVAVLVAVTFAASLVAPGGDIVSAAPRNASQPAVGPVPSAAASDADFARQPAVNSTIAFATSSLADQQVFDVKTTASEFMEAAPHTYDHHQASEQTPLFENGQSLTFLTHAELDNVGKLLVFTSGFRSDGKPYADADGVVSGKDQNPSLASTLRLDLQPPLYPKTETHPAGMTWLPAPKHTQGGYLFVTNEYVNKAVTAFYFDEDGKHYSKVASSVPKCDDGVAEPCIHLHGVNDVSVIYKDGTYYVVFFDLNAMTGSGPLDFNWEVWSAPAADFIDATQFPLAPGTAAPPTAMDLAALTPVAKGQFTPTGLHPSGVGCNAQQHEIVQDGTGQWYLVSVAGNGSCGTGGGTPYVWTNAVQFGTGGCSTVCISNTTANAHNVGGVPQSVPGGTWFFPNAEAAANILVTPSGKLAVFTGAHYDYGSGTRLETFLQSPAGVPPAPTNPSATGGNASATVSWSPTIPTGSQGAPKYWVISVYKAGVYQSFWTAESDETSVAISGLANGAGYSFRVAGANDWGQGSYSGATNVVVPAAPPAVVPGAPTNPTATAGDEEAFIGWSAPASDGGSPITGYVVTPIKAGVAQASLLFNSAGTHATMTGLVNGASYTFAVAAKSAVGIGPTSVATNAVTPSAPPAVCPPTCPRPFNDDFAAAADLPVDSYTYVASNVHATREAGEPFPLGYASGASTWAKFQRSTNGKLTIDTCGTQFDTLMTVYTGSTVGALTPVAENDEGDCGFGPSKLTVDVVAGTTYLIDVVSYDPDGDGPALPPEGFIKFTWLFQTAPGAVDTVSASSEFGRASVSWSPGSDGRSPITGYVVTPYLGSDAQAPVTFADTATTHAVSVPGVGATYTFKVAAKNAVGTGPKSDASNAVFVKAPFAPFASWSALIQRQYQDLTAKAPTAAQLSSWVSQLQGGTKTVGQLDEALRRSTENTANVDPAARLYRAFLGRTPDASGLNFWVKRRRTGAWTLNRTANFFATSSEFLRKYGTLTNQAFVTRIYTDVLGRPADPSGVTYWTKQLDLKRRSRGSVMVGFSESNEYKGKQVENTDVAVAFIMVLGRAPTAPEVQGWAELEKADPTTHAGLLTALLHSSGYQSHIAG